MALKILKRSSEDEESKQWFDGLRETGLSLADARERFNHVTQPELIEECVFEINALMARQAYFWRVIRENYPEGPEGGEGL